MTLELPRRSFLLGLGALIAAPAIVRVSSLMPVKASRVMTYADYERLILQPMIDNLKQQIYDSLVFGSSYSKFDGLSGLLTSIPAEDVLNDLHSRP